MATRITRRGEGTDREGEKICRGKGGTGERVGTVEVGGGRGTDGEGGMGRRGEEDEGGVREGSTRERGI